jgi:hypothetical protein
MATEPCRFEPAVTSNHQFGRGAGTMSAGSDGDGDDGGGAMVGGGGATLWTEVQYRVTTFVGRPGFTAQDLACRRPRGRLLACLSGSRDACHGPFVVRGHWHRLWMDYRPSIPVVVGRRRVLVGSSSGPRRRPSSRRLSLWWCVRACVGVDVLSPRGWRSVSADIDRMCGVGGGDE